jgi:hypothetical protein
VKRYQATIGTDYPTKHELIRHELHAERRGEEKKLNRLKKTLQNKLQPHLVQHSDSSQAA